MIEPGIAPRAPTSRLGSGGSAPRLATPPLGFGLYVVSRIAEIPVESVARSVLPFFIPLEIVLLLLAAVPSLSLWLPRMVLGQP